MLKGKSAVVTGSTSGIGLAIARALGNEGVNVMINGFGDKSAIEAERAAKATFLFIGRRQQSFADPGKRRGLKGGLLTSDPVTGAGLVLAVTAYTRMSISRTTPA